MRDKKLTVLASVSPPQSEAAAQFWRFENNAEANEGTLYIYGDIVTYDLGNWNWPDDVVPNRFKNELKELGDVTAIHVRINSNGGSVFAAYAIMNLLKSHAAQIIVHGDGIIASAATIIAMAGDRIITALGSVWMFHLPMLSLYGSYNTKDLKSMEDALSTITQSMLDVYNARTGIDVAEIEGMLNEDTWLTGKQALEKGFVDEIEGMEVEAYLSADNKTAFFNGLRVNISEIKNKDVLMSMLKPQPESVSGENAVPERVAFASKSNPLSPPITSAKGQEETVVNLEELKAKYPDIYKAAFNEGAAQGVQNERQRLKGIDDMALPGMEAMTDKAKYESGITAEQLAVEIVKAQKQQGVNFLNDIRSDAEQLSNVPAAAAPSAGNEEEERALLASTGERAKKLR